MIYIILKKGSKWFSPGFFKNVISKQITYTPVTYKVRVLEELTDE